MKRKVIRITITLNGQDEVFTAQGNNRISSTGLAVSTSLAYGNGAITPTAQITVYGLPMDKMLKLMRVQWNTMQALLNTVRIEVGNEGENLSIAYEGNITQATIDANAAPNIPLIITSQMAMVEKSKVAPPYTVGKDVSIDVADVVEALCIVMGYEFTNDGVSHMITSTMIEGSDLEKIQKLAIECDFDLYVDQKVIAICKKGTARTLEIPVLSPSTGLIGYPVPDIKGVAFSCVYNPKIKFGGVVTIKDSAIGGVVNQDWRLYGFVAQLEANIPNGKWQIDAQATWRDSKYAAVQK